jgi:hypothetical protein
MKAKILQAAQERLRQLKAAIQKARPKIVQEALDLFEMGLDEELVYEEIRDRYVDSVPLLAGKLDDAVDWEKVLPGLAGQIVELLDGLAIEQLLRLFVRAARRRRRRRGDIPTLGEVRGRFPRIVDNRRPAGRPAAASVSVVDVPESRPSALEVTSDPGGWGMDGGI